MEKKAETQRKSNAGRKRLPESATKTVSICGTERQIEELKKKAAKEKTSVSRFVMKACGIERQDGATLRRLENRKETK